MSQVETFDPTFVADFSTQWFEAWNQRDGDAVALLCTEDVELTDPALEATAHGRREVADWVRTCARAFPDMHFEEPEPAYLSPEGGKALSPWLMRATNTGRIDWPGIAPTGRPIVVRGVDQWWLRDGHMAQLRAFYDLHDLMRQLGLAPEPGSRTMRVMIALQALRSRVRQRA